MPCPHNEISIMSRGKGKSAVAAAAYRSGEKLTNEWDGMTHDYTRKGGVVHTEIMLPLHAPPSFSDRSTLWNSVELYEKAGNAQLAREIDAALPIELSREEQIRLVREYCSSQFVSRGMCVDYAIHDTDSGNPHCHIMLTMRPLDERGAWAAKSKKEYDLDENGERIRLPSGRYKTHKVDLTGWNDKDNTLLWRKAWADYTNDFLERNGSPERIDHRSNAERGIDELPTVHMGVAACQMEKKGIATEKGELNRSIQKTNRLIREIRAQIGKLKEWIADLFKARETAPKQPSQSPNLANLLMKYLSVQREKSRKYSQRWQQQHTADELKTIAAAVNYLSEHGISNLDELNAQILHQQIYEVGRLRRLFWGGFPRFEQVGNPFFEFPNLRPDFPDKAVCLLNTAVQFAFLGGDTFLLHLASRHAHVDGGYLVNAALGVAAVVDALRASVPLQKVVGKVSPCLTPQEGVALVVPAGKVNLVGLVSAAWQANTLAILVKVIFLFGFCRPCAAPVKGTHGKHDMTMGVAAVGVMDSEVNAHSSGNKLRGTVFPDKPDLFLSG